jgi:hypothetical protein
VRSLKLTFPIIALIALAAPAAALAGAPSHETIRGTDVDPDFCGTGETVEISFKGALNEWPDGQAGHDYQAFGQISETWVNPANGATVVTSFSGGGTSTFVDDGDGAFTWVTVRPGRPDSIRLKGGGGVLTQDVGMIVFYDHFDSDGEYIGTDVEFRGGPHPAVDPGYDWCEVMTEALGL